MTEVLLHTLVTTLYFLALINPVSKVSVLAVLPSTQKRTDFMRVIVKASLVAGSILLGSMIFGDFILRSVFRVELHSLRLAGGAILCWVGFNALRKGVFFEQEMQARFEDVALVPLACPMIAGPATIAACIALRAQEGLLVPALSIVFAVALNHIVMAFSRQISSALGRFNLLGALVRLTGLIVMTIGTQMALDGISAWQAQPFP
ncbi:MAG: MarC family protein [Kiritimatiellia bacterium]